MTQRISRRDSGLDHKTYQLLKDLSTPQKIQDFLNTLPFNFEKTGETHYSVKSAIEAGKAHCFEGALIAALALWIQGYKPLLMDLKSVPPDFDHVVAVFQHDGCWGAISKTNHSVLRYREPIYKSVRELAMSYFHEYFLKDGRKTLRSFSRPFNLSHIGIDWITSKDNLADLAHKLDSSPHTQFLTSKQIRNLRRADKIEIETGEIVEYEN